MRIAANVVAVLAWGSFLAALWLGLVAERQPPLGVLLAVVLVSLLTGMIAPGFLLGLERRLGEMAGRQGQARTVKDRQGQ